MNFEFFFFLIFMSVISFAQEETVVGNLSAKSAILMEISTGKVLMELNPDEKLSPASITKVMTILLVFEALEEGKIALEDKVTASNNASSKGGSQIWLKEGEVMSVHELLKATVIASANDACTALGEYVAGDETTFVSMMNEKAKALGMTNTTVNKNGKAIGPSRDASNSSISKLNEITVEQFLSLLSTDDETWKNMVDMTYADINIIITSVNGAANKIKAKQYLKNHPVEGKNTDFKFIFQNVDESNIEGYAYKFTGMYNCPFTKEASPVFIIFYSNNDEYVEQKNGTSILAKGTINNIGTDELIGFSISSITVFE